MPAIVVEVERPQLLGRIIVHNAWGLLTMQTIGATAADCRRGCRVTHTETVEDQAQLLCRLAEMMAAMCWQDDAVATAE